MVSSQEERADQATELYTNQCLARATAGRGQKKTWTVIVRVGNSTFNQYAVEARTPQERADKMGTELKLGNDAKFAYGTCQGDVGGNDPRAMEHLKGLLPR